MDNNQIKTIPPPPPGFVVDKPEVELKPPLGFILDKEVKPVTALPEPPPGFILDKPKIYEPLKAEVPDIETQKRIKKFEREQKFKKLAMLPAKAYGGAAESILALGTGVPTYMAGLGAQVGKTGIETLARGGLGKGTDPLAIYDTIQRLGENVKIKEKIASIAYQPRTKLGQQLTRGAVYPFELYLKGVDTASSLVTDDPIIKAGIRTIAEVAVIAVAPKVTSYLKGVVRAKVPVGLNKLRGLVKESPKMPKESLELIDKIVGEKKIAEKLITKKPALEPELPTLPAIEKIMTALKKAKPLRGKQEAMYVAERAKRMGEALKVGKRVAGEKGFQAELAQLKGEMKRIRFESIRNKLTQTDIDNLFIQVKKSPALTTWEKISARKGLAKLFGEYGGDVPVESELILLNRVFPKEFVRTILSKRDTWAKTKEIMLEVASVPRALMASYDLSFGFRQGILLMTRYPREFFSAFAKQFEMFGSEKAFKAINENIAKHKNYPLVRKAKLQLTEMDSALGLREEMFLGARLAEKIPLVGRGVRASNRAYTGMANKLRFDVFNHLIESAEKAGLKPRKDIKLLRDIADFVNVGSGRGTLPGGLERSAVTLNAALFAPRYMAARLKALWPPYYVKLHPFARKQALQSLLAFAGMGTTMATIAKLNGCDVGINPLSSDFGKIKIGNTRIDIWGGFQQYIRTAAQFITGKTVSSTTGRVTKVGEGYKPLTRLSILGRWLEYKQAPVMSFGTDLLRGRTVMGEEIKIEKEVSQRFIPMVIQDVIDIAKDDPDLLPVSALGIFGVGLQTYAQPEKSMIDRWKGTRKANRGELWKSLSAKERRDLLRQLSPAMRKDVLQHQREWR